MSKEKAEYEARAEAAREGLLSVEASLRTENAALRQQVAELQEEMRLATGKIRDLTIGNKTLQQERERLEKKVAELLTELNRVREVSAKQADERDELRAEVGRLKTQESGFAELEHNNRVLMRRYEDKVVELRAEVERLLKSAPDCIMDMTAELARLRQENVGLKASELKQIELRDVDSKEYVKNMQELRDRIARMDAALERIENMPIGILTQVYEIAREARTMEQLVGKKEEKTPPGT